MRTYDKKGILVELKRLLQHLFHIEPDGPVSLLRRRKKYEMRMRIHRLISICSQCP